MTGVSSSAVHEIQIAIGPSMLPGTLNIPTDAHGVVLFAHGSGSSRLSPRNRYVAQALQESNLATLLIDLLTEEEERTDIETRELRFNIKLLAERIITITDWLVHTAETRRLRIGYFGASTGGGAALVAAAQRPDNVGAVVSRGGRPDLAGPYLRKVQAPVLLIVGERDLAVLGMNRQAYALIETPKELAVVPEATHLFEEPGALGQVADLARGWFNRYLSAIPAVRPPRVEL
jgi:dienelactone hydrolase